MAQFAPETAVRCVIEDDCIAESRDGVTPESSPIVSPGMSWPPKLGNSAALPLNTLLKFRTHGGNSAAWLSPHTNSSLCWGARSNIAAIPSEHRTSDREIAGNLFRAINAENKKNPQSTQLVVRNKLKDESFFPGTEWMSTAIHTHAGITAPAKRQS
jgi:hypothetical protein